MQNKARLVISLIIPVLLMLGFWVVTESHASICGTQVSCSVDLVCSDDSKTCLWPGGEAGFAYNSTGMFKWSGSDCGQKFIWFMGFCMNPDGGCGGRQATLAQECA